MNSNTIPWQSKVSDDPCCEPNALIQVKDLSLSYGTQSAFENISLDIDAGCVTGIVGPSGCGKSSFLHCLNRMTDFIEGTKVDGDIHFLGESHFDSRRNLQQLRRDIGIVFQEPITLPISIDSNLRLPLKEHGFANIEDRVKKALQDVGLWNEVSHKLKTPAANLSGGQKQRLSLARTIALEPKVILMDEPCSSLDPIATESIENLIRDLRGQYTMVIITHNLAQARRLCDKVAVFWYNSMLKSGEMIEFGSTAEIFNKPKHKLVQEYVGGIRG